ncbi:hypothetical protein BJP34_28215 [Moorena producens PAL-8-15-08-1]|uniref:Uncharacterized protein n=1 Tax=Moorena producens PAL-8-15-08-1 TaxID=1458985 RepID=A0A1D8TYT0_9CYAN|nr:hypothetical protein [Moorena producens]AOX02807.1 hypothetical protein BJP34_28215 [Moorena producens PAL-8-15-08-1]
MKLINNYNISCKLQLMGAIAGSVTMVLYPAIAEAESTQAAEENLPVIDLKPSQLPSLDLKQEPILSFNPGLVPSLNQNELSTTIALRQSSSFNINDGQFPSFDLSSDQVPRLNWKREPIVSFNSTLTPSPIPQTEPSSHIALAPVVDLSKGRLPSFDLLPGQLPQLNSPKALLANLDLKQQQRVSLNRVNTEARQTIPIPASQSYQEIAYAPGIDIQLEQLPNFAVNGEFPNLNLSNAKLDNLQLRSQQRVSLNPSINTEARQTIPIPASQSNQEIAIGLWPRYGIDLRSRYGIDLRSRYAIAASIDFQRGKLPEFEVNGQLPQIDLTNNKLDNLQLRSQQRVSLNPSINTEARQTIPIPETQSPQEMAIAASIDFQQGKLPEFEVNRELPQIDLTNDKLDNLQLRLTYGHATRSQQRVSLNQRINPEARKTIPIPETQSPQDIAYAPGIDIEVGDLPNFEVNGEFPNLDLTNDKLDNLELLTQQRVSLNQRINPEARKTIPIPETQSPQDIAYAPGIDIEVGDLPNFEVNGEFPNLDLTNDKLDNLELLTQQRVSLNQRINPEARKTIPIPETQSPQDIAYAPGIDIEVGDLPNFEVNGELPKIDLTNDKLDNLELRTPQRVSFNSINNETRETLPIPETQLDQDIAYAPDLDIQVGDLPNFELNGNQLPKIDLSNDKLDNLELRTPQRVSFNSINNEARETLPIPETQLDQDIAYAPGIDIQVGDLPEFAVNSELPKIDLTNDKLDNLELPTPQRVSFNSINREAKQTLPIPETQLDQDIAYAPDLDIQVGDLPNFEVNREQLPKIDLSNDKLDNLELRTPQRVSFNSINNEAKETIPIPETQLDQDIAYAPDLDIQVGDLPEFAVNRELPKIDLTNDKLDNLELPTPERVSFNSINREARETLPIPETQLDQDIAYAPDIDIQVGDLPNFEVNGNQLPKIDLTNDKLDNLELPTPERVSFNSINREARQTLPIPETQLDQDIAYAPGIDIQVGDLPNFEVNGNQLPKIDLTNDKLDNLELPTPQRVSFNSINNEAKETLPIPETQLEQDIAYAPDLDIQVGDLPNFEVNGELLNLDLTNDKLDNLELRTPQKVSFNSINREARETLPIPETQLEQDIAYAPDIDIQVGDLPNFEVNGEFPNLDLSNDKLDNFQLQSQQTVSLNPTVNPEPIQQIEASPPVIEPVIEPSQEQLISFNLRQEQLASFDLTDKQLLSLDLTQQSSLNLDLKPVELPTIAFAELGEEYQNTLEIANYWIRQRRRNRRQRHQQRRRESTPSSTSKPKSSYLKVLAPTSEKVLDIPATSIILQYGLGAEVELRVNGKLIDPSFIGRTETDTLTNLVTRTWYGIVLKEGENTITATIAGSDNVISIPVQVRGTPDKLVVETREARIPADGRSLATVQGRLLDKFGNVSHRDTIVTLYTSDGEFVGVDQNPDQPGFQVEARKGQFTTELRSGLDAKTIRISAATNDLEAFTQMQFETALRPSLITGVIDMRLGTEGTDFFRSFRDFLPEDEDDDTKFDIRSAAFFTGSLGNWLITGSFNTDHALNKGCDCNDSNRLFREYQSSEQDYPVYGDSSTVDVTTPSIDNLYLRLERSGTKVGIEADYLMWGDYNTEEFSRRSQLFTSTRRKLHGFKTNYNFGKFQITGLFANNVEGFQRDTIVPDGTSGFYFLSRRLLVAGSEEVYIELEELQRPGTVIRRERLSRVSDYEIDYDRGTLLFNQPMLRTDLDQEGRVLVRRIVVTYQFDGDSEDTNIYAGRFQYNFSRELNQESWLGASYLRENQGARDFELYGVDGLFSFGENVQLITEYAHSTNDSDELGLVSGSAYRVQLDGKFGDAFSGKAYLRSTETGFANNATVSFVPGQTRYGAQFQAKVTDTTNFRVQVDRETNRGIAPRVVTSFGDLFDPRTEPQAGNRVDNSLTTVIAGIKQRIGPGSLQLDWVFRDREDRKDDSRSRTSNQLRSRFKMPLTDNLTFQALNELTLSSETDSVYSDRTAIGLDWRVYRGITINLGQQWFTRGQFEGQEITHLGISGDYNLGSDTTISGRYSIVGGLDQMTGQGAIGLKQGWTIFPGMRLNLAYERVLGNFLGENAAADQFSQPYAFGQGASALGFESGESYSIGFEYTDSPDFKASFKWEHRSSNRGNNTVITGAASGKLSPAITALFSYRQANGANQRLRSRLGNSINLRLGVAYRNPESDNFNALMRYEFRQNPATIPDTILLGSGSGYNEHLFSGEMIYAPNWRWEFYGKYALRYSRSYLSNDLIGDSTIHLGQLRASYRLGYNWDIVGEARLISQPSADYFENGFLIETGYYLTPSLRLAAGYSLGNIDDYDFRGSRSASGPYLGLTVKLDGLIGNLFGGFGNQKVAPPQQQESQTESIVEDNQKQDNPKKTNQPVVEEGLEDNSKPLSNDKSEDDNTQAIILEKK